MNLFQRPAPPRPAFLLPPTVPTDGPIGVQHSTPDRIERTAMKTNRLIALFASLLPLALFAQTATEATSTDVDSDVVVLEVYEVNSVPLEQVILPSARPFNSVYGTDRGILDTPRNVTIFSREQLTAISIQDVRDFTKLTTSSYTRTNFGAPSTPDLRGLIGDMFLNGMRVGLSSNGNGLPINFNSVESINIVKGPATAVYGASQYIGGYADMISKQPYFDRARGSAAVTVGSFDTLRWTLDYGAPVNDRLAYRLSYSGEHSDGYYNDSKKETQALYLAISKQVSDTYRWWFNNEIYYAEYTENFGWNRVTQDLIDHGLYQTGVNNNPAPDFTYPFGYVDANGNAITLDNINVVAGTAAPVSDAQNSTWVVSGFPAVNRMEAGPVVALDRRMRLLKPGDDSNGVSYSAQLIQTFNPNPDLEIGNNTAFRYIRRNTLSSYMYSEIIDPSWSIENRTEFRITKEKHSINTGASVRYQFVEAYNDFFSEPANVWDLTRDLNLADYTNSVSFPNPFTQIPVPGWPGRVYTPDNGDSGISKVWSVGPFYQHDLKIDDQWSVLFGGRVDVTKIDFHIDWVNSIIGPQSIADETTVGLPSANLSVLYKPTTESALYATYNYSQNPVGATGNGGGLTTAGGATFPDGFLRNEAILYEIGYKRTFDEGKGFFNIALFDQARDALQQDNTLRTYKTRGVELELNYQPNKNLYVTAGYSFMDATVNQAEFDVGNTSFTSPLDRFFTAPAGKIRRQGMPENSFNALATYKWDNGFGVTAGFVYTSNILNNVKGTFVIPAQYNLDLTAFYATKTYEVRVAVLNATDEENFGAPNAVYGNESIVAELPIRVEATLKYKF
jgi:catecholate siderophore receptor